MTEPCKILVERTSSQPPAVSIRFAGRNAIFISEDTAQVLARALQQVAFAEKTRLMVYEETGTRPAWIS